MDTEGQVTRQCPRSGRPSDHTDTRLLIQGECDDDSGIIDLFVILSGFKIGQGSGAPGGVRHDPKTFINQPFVPQLFEDPPNGLHVPRIQRFVVILEIDPATFRASKILVLVMQ